MMVNDICSQHCLENCMVKDASMLFLEGMSFSYHPPRVILSFVLVGFLLWGSAGSCRMALSTALSAWIVWVHGDGAQLLHSSRPQQHPGTPPKGTQPTQSPPPHADDNPKPSWCLIPSSTSCPRSLPRLPINISCKVEMGSYFKASSSQVTKYWAATHFQHVWLQCS